MNEPKIPPPMPEELEKMTDTVAAMLEKESGVEAAYLIMLYRHGGEPTLTIALHFNESVSNDDKTAYTPQLMPIAEAVIKRPVLAVSIDGNKLADVQSQVEPFYKRDTIISWSAVIIPVYSIG